MNTTVKNALRILKEEFDRILFVDGQRDEAGRIVKAIHEMGDKLYDECVGYDLDQLNEEAA